MPKELHITFVTGPRKSGKSYIARMLYEAALVAKHDQKRVLWFDESYSPTFASPGMLPIRQMGTTLDKMLAGIPEAEIFISSGNEHDVSVLISNYSFGNKVTVRRVVLSKEESW